jgi:hypothetical protein
MLPARSADDPLSCLQRVASLSPFLQYALTRSLEFGMLLNI